MPETVTKSEKPQKLVTVVCACIKAPGGRDVLLSMRRAPGIPGLDGKWELPGGKIEFGETPVAAIAREIQEELGLRIKVGRLLPYLHTNLWEYPHVTTHVVLAGYECELAESSIPKLGPDARWCRPEEIDFDDTLPGTREFITLALKDDLFNRISITFESGKNEGHSQSQFTVATQPTLFSEYGLVKYWGKVGDRLKVRIEEFDSPRLLDYEIIEIAKRKLADGYHITAVKGPDRAFKPLLNIIEIAKARNQFSSI
ncbi:NUDIX domain-containing protein [Acidobacteria bacterium AB60]|nr:NUDIX domain-containing protein [Acidobacteria bacterium AB60]